MLNNKLSPINSRRQNAAHIHIYGWPLINVIRAKLMRFPLLLLQLLLLLVTVNATIQRQSGIYNNADI